MTYAGSTLGFDRENRLTAVGSNWTAGYRADGLRAWKQSGSTRTYYLYDQGEPLIEMDASGAAVAVNVFSPDGLVGRWTSASGTVYYSFDVQGSVAQRIDSSGNVLSSSCYDGYGAESSTGTAPTDCFGYNARWGYVLDRETGMYLCQHRYYDPANGRWLTRDPIGYAGGVNVYGYCEGGPVGIVDPMGLAPKGFLQKLICDQIASQIRRWFRGDPSTKGVMSRYFQMLRDKYDLWSWRPGRNPAVPGAGTWQGHHAAYDIARRKLSEALELWDRQNCDDDLPKGCRGARGWAARGAPATPIDYVEEATKRSTREFIDEYNNRMFGPFVLPGPFPFPIPIPIAL